MSSVLGLPKSVPSQDTLLDSPRCFVLEKPTAKSGRATEAVSSAGVVSGKTKVYNLLRHTFCKSLWCLVFSPVDVHCHPSTKWCCEPCDCRWIPILSWVFRGFIPIHNGSRADLCLDV